MARYTDRWGLSILGSGDAIQDEGFKFADADRRLIDRLLAYATEQHHHTGQSGTDRTPVAGLNLVLATSGGSIPSGTRYHYRYTVIDEYGNESAPSPIQSIDTPISIISPQAPNPTAVTGSGSLLPGPYSYVISAYKDANTLETKATNSAAVTIPGTNASNSVSMILPDLPLGATGLNIYRKEPSGLYYLYITSIAAPTHGQTWLDDGSITPNYNRGLPPVNRTSGGNMVYVTFPGATPYIPDGWSWAIYRSEDPTDWGRSFLTQLNPQGATPVTPTTYPDVGAATQIGGPPSQAQVINAPSKILLTDAAEVQGSLPPGLVVAPQIITFVSPGPVDVREGTFTWICDYDMADIVHCRAYLGVDSIPAAQDVIVDVNIYQASGATPTWTSIFEDGPNRPTVPVGQTIGDIAVPTIRRLVAGDALCVDIDQAGGGATPTDTDLTVNILLYVKDGSETTSYVW